MGTNQCLVDFPVSSTTPTVEKISSLKITGNITPKSWFRHIHKITKTGKEKTDFLAIGVLSEIVYWYKETLVKDKQGKIFSKKKFNADMLQKSYNDFAELFCVPKENVKESIDLLVNLGILRREFRTIFSKGTLLNNVMYLEPIIEKLEEVTYYDCENKDKTLTNVGLVGKLGGASPENWGDKYIDYYNREKEITMFVDTTSANASVVSTNRFPETSIVESLLGLRGEADKEEKSIFSPPIFPTHLDGFFSLDSVCETNFGEHTNFTLEFLRGVNNSFDDSEKALLNFVNTISKDFSTEAILGGMHYVEQRFNEGIIPSYNLNYIRRGIEIYIANNKIDEDSMKTNVVGKFRRFCRDHFHNDELGDSVYTFYVTRLTDTKGTDNMIKNIKLICNEYGEQFLFRAMRVFIKYIDAGVYSTKSDKSLRHFLDYINKVAASPHKIPTKSTDIVTVDANGNRRVIPVAIERINYDFSGNDEWYDWSYRCCCGEPMELRYKHCPNCKHEIDWSMVIFKGVKCGFRASTHMFKLHKLM